MDIIDHIFTLLEERGHGLYFGEGVTELEHALQCAHLGERAHATDEAVTAALLHDVGHLLHGLPEDVAEQGVDARHEEGGARWLAQHFGPAVVDPIRLHVAAKRYLCAAKPGFFQSLSPASQLSLQLQGGAYSPEEMRRFETETWFRSALTVRMWDDAAKVPGLLVPGLAHYRPRLEAALHARARG
jgi:phosphonate degradation associated HDIG domain protein